MRRLLVPVAVVAVVVALGFGLLAPADESERVTAGTPAPGYSAPTIDGSVPDRDLAGLRGDVVLLNIWATWCPPCVEEMPTMQRLQEEYGSRGLRVVAVSIDDRGAEPLIREFVAEHGLTFEILHDPAATVMDLFQASGVPQTFLIDRSGRIRLTRFATDWFSDESRAEVEALLDEAD
ncbi:MAG: TlpA family protein disulfide reductase [Gemmatimonadetes bacterium]|nr:TlpA family protein disulfide reductase [Gemmatimonadota bacterium]